MLTPEELKEVLPAETSAFPSPIPAQRVSSDALGAADGPVKTAIFGGNNARIYKFSPKQQAEVITDRVAQIKDVYERHGEGRSNVAYGYVARPRS